ncbi:guanine nucleotide exchange factor [Phlebopus sp. FC_14]|nr:guanine nucleotide exchange factor [Phlebopus sp. FC_14]
MEKTRSLADDYASLNSRSPREEVLRIFAAIHDATLDIEVKKTLAQSILDDLRADKSISRLLEDEAHLAIRAVKDLGYAPEVATVLATPPNLRCLLNLSPKFEKEPENPALRCIANTILLNESARTTLIGNDVGGGTACVDLLQNSTSAEYIFLASRILFLCTVSIYSSASFIKWLVECKRQNVDGSRTAVDIIAMKMDELVSSLVAGNDVKTPMTDLLKLTFNLCVHYPKLVHCEAQSPDVKVAGSDQKVMGDHWSPQLDSLLPPLLRAFHNIPLRSRDPHNALVPPLSHVIHALITIPISPTARHMWFGSQPSSSVPHSSPSESASSSSPASPTHETQPRVPVKGPKPKPLERALSALSARRPYSRSSPSRSSTPTAPDTAARAYELLDITLSHFMPDEVEPDIEDVRSSRCKSEDDFTLDDVSPLGILLTRICLADEDAKLRLRSWFVPANIDRTTPLEQQPTLLGRCLRLLKSYTQLNSVIGEMLFAMFDSNPETLIRYVGYGNVAGLLFHKGITDAPMGSSTSGGPITTPAGLPINPITGTIEREREPDNMTEEEKEQEAEKLFSLLDRMEKTGAIQPSQNPIRKAIEQGKIQ